MSKLDDLELEFKEKNILKLLDEKLGLLDDLIKDLRSVLKEPSEDKLTNSYETDESVEAKKEIEESKPTITLEDVRAILADLSRNGKTIQVKELLRKFGSSKLSEVRPEDYENLLKEAGEL